MVFDKNRTNLDEFQKNKIKELLLEVRDAFNVSVSCDEIETFETFYSWARKEGFLPVDSRQMARAVSTEPGCNLYAQVYTISYTWAKQKWQRWDAHRIATMIANKQTLFLSVSRTDTHGQDKNKVTGILIGMPLGDVYNQLSFIY